jgi:Protein of unknown function (DUF1302)
VQHPHSAKPRTDLRLTSVSAAILALAVFALAATPAQAFEIETANPDLAVRWDNTLRYNLGWRVNEPNKSLVGNNAVFDEGEFSFGRGNVVTNRMDLLSEFDLVYQKKLGFRVSAAAWLDDAYRHGTTHRNPAIPAAASVGSYVGDTFSPFTQRYYAGPSGEFLDAFVFGAVDLGGSQLNLKAGRHTVFWGESLLLGGALHGIAAGQSPIDLQKGFATPGAEAKELFRPLTQISASLQANKDLSFAAQYFFDWEPSRYPEGGTFLGPGDFAFTGPQRVLTSVGLLGNSGIREPNKRGDVGLSARWSPEWLDGTLGFYYRNYTDKVLALLINGGATPVAGANPLGLRYSQFYGEDIDLFGLSLAKQLGGVSIGADLSYRKNMPLNAQTLGLAPTAMVGPLAPLAPFLFAKAGLAGNTLNGNTYQARGNTLHLVVNALGLLPKTALFDSASYAAELTYSRLEKVTANPDMYFGEGYGVCNPTLLTIPSPAVKAQYKDKWAGCSTKDHLGLGVSFTPTWFQAFPGTDVSLPISFSQTIKGNSPVVLGGNERNGNYSLGVSADVYQKYRFDLKYVDFFGKTTLGTVNGLTGVVAQNGLSTLLKDRGHLVFTFKTTF